MWVNYTFTKNVNLLCQIEILEVKYQDKDNGMKRTQKDPYFVVVLNCIVLCCL